MSRRLVIVMGMEGAGYRYIGIDTTQLDVAEAVSRVQAAIPEIYAGVRSR